MPHSTQAAYDQWLHPNRGVFFKKVWKASFFIILWTLWRERNNRCFKNISCPTSHLQDLVLLRITGWIKGWGDEFPYSSNDIIRHPLCLKWESGSSKSQQASRIIQKQLWAPPPSSLYKWNVDASLKFSEDKSAIGGVLRNHHGEFVCLFSRPIPFMEINHAEIFAIYIALKISQGIKRIYHGKFIEESDSANDVSWCNGGNNDPWNLNFIINFIRHAMKNGQGVDIFYRSRETIVVADSLAKRGLTRQDEFIAWC
ncbi:uncharacterized protein [Spinacia oleracea]|uniref:RNase H type-1 domain-containing protein n=1 Tax=Spinacia oleracea TaxID=3562 RepID=A0ABM3R8U5_SPIOL|nr:uncharacterized protein LOC130467522 [Spinacia oleracea]